MADPQDNTLLLEKKRRQLLAAKRMLLARKAQDRLLDYTRFTTPDPEDAENPEASLYNVKSHHELIADMLEQVEDGRMLERGVRICCLSVGPQKGKSELCSRKFLSWAIGKKPTRNIMFGTYNQDFANEFGDEVRNKIQSSEHRQVFPKCNLRTGSKAKDHMVTTMGGKLSFLGRGGSGTGRPADIFVIDDPIKDAKEADSLTIRNDVWNWFNRVVQTRCHAYSVIFIIHTRWHEDDLIGRLTDPTNSFYNAEFAKQVMYVNIPSIMDEPKVARALGLKVGQSIWEDRFPLKMLQMRQAIDPIGFSAMEMGKPTPPEGAFFKNSDLNTYGSIRDLPQNYRVYLSGDLALSPERDRDSSVVGVWLLDENDELWLHPDLFWDQVAADKSVDEIIRLISTYKPFDGFWEKGQIAKAVGPFLEKQMREEGVWMNITAFPATGSKGARCISSRGRMAQGKMHFPSFAPWWPRAKEQMLKFTGSGSDKEDDFCDMVGLVGQGLGEQIKASKPKERKAEVVEIGSIRWIKYQHDLERKAARRKEIQMRGS